MNPIEPALRESSEGIYLHCWIQPKASKSRICGMYGNSLKIQIAAVPEKGKANSELCRFLSKILHTAKSNISLAKGEISRDKTVLITGISKKDLLGKIQLDEPD